MVMPEDVAEAYWYIHNQKRTAWTGELDLRSWNQSAWFNSDFSIVNN